jgi:hypothetical protein
MVKCLGYHIHKYVVRYGIFPRQTNVPFNSKNNQSDISIKVSWKYNYNDKLWITSKYNLFRYFENINTNQLHFVLFFLSWFKHSGLSIFTGMSETENLFDLHLESHHSNNSDTKNHEPLKIHTYIFISCLLILGKSKLFSQIVILHILRVEGPIR